MYLIKKLNKNILNFSILLLIFVLFMYVYFYYKNIKEGLNTDLNTDFAKSFCDLNQSSGQELKKNVQHLLKIIVVLHHVVFGQAIRNVRLVEKMDYYSILNFQVNQYI